MKGTKRIFCTLLSKDCEEKCGAGDEVLGIIDFTVFKYSYKK